MSTVTQHSEWLRGVLGLCVLRTLAGGPSYGYAIATALAEAGLGEVKGGTLYPLLARLEKNALVTVEWRAGEGGPGRKYFALTEAGEGRVGSLTDRLALLCYGFDAARGIYTPLIQRILTVAGIVTILAIGLLILGLTRLTRTRAG